MGLKIRNPLYMYSSFCLFNTKCFSAQKQHHEILCWGRRLTPPTFTCSFVFSSVSRRCLSQLGPSTWDQQEHGAYRGHAGTGEKTWKAAGQLPGEPPCSRARWPMGGSSLRLVYAAGDSALSRQAPHSPLLPAQSRMGGPFRSLPYLPPPSFGLAGEYSTVGGTTPDLQLVRLQQ